MTPKPDSQQVPGDTATKSCPPSLSTTAVTLTSNLPAAPETLQDRVTAAQWQGTFDAVSSAIWLLDPQGRILRANRATAQIFGKDTHELVGRTCCEVVHGTQERPARCPVHRLCRSLQRERLELRIGDRWLEITVDPIFNAAGQLAGVVHITNDITRRKHAEQALRQSRDHLAMALDVAQLGTFERHLLTNVSTWSDQAYRLLGYLPGEVPPSFEAWIRRVHPADQAAAQAHTEAAFRSGGIYNFEYRVCWPDGSVHWLADRWRVHLDAEGHPSRLLGVSMEVTEQRETEELLRKTTETEHQINTVLEAMVQERAAKFQAMAAELQHLSYAIMHDLRAPLRAICGYAELLRQQCVEQLAPQHQDFLHRITAATTIMDRLITDALCYDRALRQKLDLTPVDAAEVLRRILASYPQFQSCREHIQLEGVIPLVLANEAGLSQCLAHLLDNALKFVPAGVTPQVRVWAELVDSGGWIVDRAPANTAAPTPSDSQPSPLNHQLVRLYVQDNGVGIDKQFQSRIFDLFQRGTNYQEGTGLGLALVRKITEQMGGRVGVESEPGQGSRFWMELPAAPAPQKAA